MEKRGSGVVGDIINSIRCGGIKLLKLLVDKALMDP